MRANVLRLGVALVCLRASSVWAAPAGVDAALVPAVEAFEAGDYARATDLLTQARTVGRGGPLVLCYLGRTAAAQGRPKEAVELLEAYRKAGPVRHHRRWLRATLAELRARLAGQPGRLEVWSTGGGGGQVSVDGQPVACAFDYHRHVL